MLKIVTSSYYLVLKDRVSFREQVRTLFRRKSPNFHDLKDSRHLLTFQIGNISE